MNKIVTNFFWRFAERCGSHGITFIVSIILARLLDPALFGTVALITVFTSILNVFVDSGFGNALVQKKDADDLDFSSVFWFNLFACFLIYLLLYAIAPQIAYFYENINLVSLIRVASITILISGIKNVQQAYITRKIQFKKFFYATITGTLISAFLGIWMAYHGYGVWSLVIPNLVNNFIDTVILWTTVKWHPKFLFSLSRIKSLFSFGWKLFLSSLLDTGYNKVRDLIIGKKYSSSDLAFFNKGSQFPHFIVVNINSSIDSVLFPTMSKKQEDISQIREMTRQAIKVSTFIMMPMMMGLAVCAEPIIRIVLTEKWLPCVPYLRIYCFSYAFWPVHTSNLIALKALGRSDYFFKLEIVKKIIGVLAILITMRFGVIWMAYSLIFTSITSQIINSYPNKKLLDYGYKDQLLDMLPQLLLTCFMGIVIYFVTFLKLNDIITLMLQIFIGIAVYYSGSIILKIDSTGFLMALLKDKKVN